MKHKLFLISLILQLITAASACAESWVHVIYGETYMCGDSFEIRFPDEPLTTTMVSRKPPGSAVVVAQAGEYDILLEVRIQFRNLTTDVYDGLSPESFKLMGYVRGRPQEYTPEVMAPYDYGSRESYRMYDKMYYRSYVLAPLRKIDMLLVYRINPIMRDLELHIEPQPTNELLDHYLQASYTPMELERCNGTFQFITIRDAETGEMTKYYR